MQLAFLVKSLSADSALQVVYIVLAVWGWYLWLRGGPGGGGGMTHALVMGRFYPPHLGHHHLIRTAAEHADRVTVVVGAAQVETISLADRVEWLRAVHDEPVTVVGLPCDIPVDLHSEPVRRAHVANLLAGVRQAVVRAGLATPGRGGRRRVDRHDDRQRIARRALP
ncbi:adenylyltransferase/cytidyltransferase family protein [Cryptosporangium sp. NPDC051539]|uniref:adenylyltransferase/cytidyltransferase family protein n=1 Tax=Cryptosporangium sp. NPDC051539 TaxID=3363962 RepID=UPI0037912D2A